MSVNNQVVERLEPIQKRIGELETQSVAYETKSILDRWEFGRILLEQRAGKQLPRGLRALVEEEFGLEASEITRRMQLADTFKTLEDVQAACERCGGAWRRVIRELSSKDTVASQPADFGQRATWRVDKWISEVGNDAALRAELVKALQAALDKLSADRAQVAA